jgi:hypothetical protein
MEPKVGEGGSWHTHTCTTLLESVQFFLLCCPWISDSRFLCLLCRLVPVTLRELLGLQPWTGAKSLLSVVLRLPASWNEQVLVSLAL